MKYFREASSDQQYWIRVERWNKHDDNTLLAFLEVDPKLIMGEIHAFICACWFGRASGLLALFGTKIERQLVVTGLRVL